jgi:hypothetical protein
MANGRNKLRRGDAGRDAGGFVALPWSVLDSPAYSGLSHPAKALLLEFARQFVRDNNGRLLCSMTYLGPRGWKSNDVITRAVRELVAAGFVHQTAQGHRPSKASWYAVTWRALDRHPGYDVGTMESFQRGAYRLWVAAQRPTEIAPPTPSPGAEKNASLTPSPGVERASRAPSPGVGALPTAPSPGAVEGGFGTFSTPGDGDHLEKPSTAQRSGDVQEVEGVQERWANIEQEDDAASSRREAAPRPTRPKRRLKPLVRKEAVRSEVRTESAAQMELLLAMDVFTCSGAARICGQNAP